MAELQFRQDQLAYMIKRLKISLTWYGRCCFLIKVNNKKILIDPHDDFDNIEMGKVDADYTLISSTWHDHGHIGASPKAIIFSEPGIYKIDKNITITGIETKETRGTKNIIFNIKAGEYSITNFADFGDPKSIKGLNPENKKILALTNIAFVRPHQILHEKNTTSGELALRTCDPKIIIPHHYYPASFAQKRKPQLKRNMLKFVDQVANMIKKFEYKKILVKSHKKQLDISAFKEKSAIVFEKMHPQVVYTRK